MTNKKIAAIKDVSVTKYFSELIWSRSPNSDGQIDLNLCMDIILLYSMFFKYITKFDSQKVKQDASCIITVDIP